jgi:hypothetical protein
MFDKLIKIKEQELQSAQTKEFKVNQYIKESKERIYQLKNNSEIPQLESSLNINGHFLASSIHYKTINQNIKKEEELIQKQKQLLVEIKSQLKVINLDLEKYKHIKKEEIKAKLEEIKYQEELELDQFLQRKNNFN